MRRKGIANERGEKCRGRRADTQWIKHIYPLGLTMWALSWSALSYGPGFEAGRQTAYLDGTLRWGYDWMMKVGHHNFNRV